MINFFYTTDPYEAKYHLLLNKRKGVGLEQFNNSKPFIEYSNKVHNIYGNIEEYNPDKDRKILIAFDDLIADMLSNKTLDSIVTELFIRGRKLNIFFCFYYTSLFCYTKKHYTKF